MSTSDQKNYKIVGLSVENIKKLVAVDIKPDGSLVQITGKNEQGKTSVLDSIWWAIEGAKHIQVEPIRVGADKARIRLDLGEIVVTRTFDRKDQGFTTKVVVESAEGARFPSPQTVLDGLYGALTFDPLAFSRKKPAEQFDALREMVPGFDFVAFESQQRGDYERRTDFNRTHKEASAAASLIVVPDDLPAEPVNTAALLTQMQEASNHNSDLETRKARRQQASEQITKHAADIARIETERVKAIENADREIANITARRDALVHELNSAIEGHRSAAADLQQRLDTAEELPSPIDVQAIRKQIDDAAGINKLIEARTRKADLTQAASKALEESQALTERMEQREKAKNEAIAAAKLPVKGLSLGNGMVLYNGVPFEQASDAVQLRVSMAIAMASNPSLRVIRVRDGSLLDEDALQLVADMAKENDYQVWIERVDSSGSVGVVLENGFVKGAKKPEQPAAA